MAKTYTPTPDNSGGKAAPKHSDKYNSDSLMKDKNFHQGPKDRQDGKGSGRGNADSKDHLWKYTHSVNKGPGKK